jgi:hypothetical protein
VARQQLRPVVETEEPTITSIDPEPPPEREIYRARPSDLYTRSAPSSDLAAPVWSTPGADIATSATIGPRSDVAFAVGEDGLPQMVPAPQG